MGSVNFRVPDDLLEVWKDFQLNHPNVNASDYFRATLIQIMVEYENK